MAQARYNYLPHPISEYGVYRTLPEDSVMQILARKDQATWNFSYLTCPKLLDSWHNLHALPSSEEANTWEALIYSASGMKCKEPGAQKARHIMKIGELSSTARRRNSPAQAINQRFPRAARLLFDYNAINAIIDGVSVRHQVLHLPPEEFVSWFNAVGGLSMLEGYGQGSPRIADKHVKALQDFLPVTARRLVAWVL